MGSGRWSTDVYDAARSYRAATGASAFAYSDSGATGVHPSLNPHGVTVRESRDSDEHPRSTAIAVLFDVTGSMGSVPRTLQAKMSELFGLLLRKGYVADPQILFGAIGDATCDGAPLQVGQFESDNRIEEMLANIYLEGGGGGQVMESYELAMYFMARHTSIDCYDKRGRKGYLFIIGDEKPYAAVKPDEVTAVIGDRLGEKIGVRAMLTELQQRFEVFYLMPTGSYYAGNSGILDTWRKLLGQNVIELDDLDAACETIAVTIGLAEEAIDLAEGLDDLADVGSSAGTVVGKALAKYGTARGSVVRSTVLAGLDDGGPADGAVRV